MGQPQRACVNCHFFVKEYRQRTTQTGSVDKAQRKEMLHGQFGSIKEHYVLCCAQGVWDEGRQYEGYERVKEIVKRDRGDECFFMPDVPGMSIPAAQVLQER